LSATFVASVTALLVLLAGCADQKPVSLECQQQELKPGSTAFAECVKQRRTWRLYWYGPYPWPNALYTTWGVYPYEMRHDGSALLINGLTPVDPMEHH
jgi:hypothetical protein